VLASHAAWRGGMAPESPRALPPLVSAQYTVAISRDRAMPRAAPPLRTRWSEKGVGS